jgi:hypothetical protein
MADLLRILQEGTGYLRVDPSIESLRSHPRFQRLLAVADSLAR